MYIKHLLNATIFMLEGDKTLYQARLKTRLECYMGFFKRVTVHKQTRACWQNCSPELVWTSEHTLRFYLKKKIQLHL